VVPGLLKRGYPAGADVTLVPIKVASVSVSV